jgi:hypothetical protein
VQESRPAAAAWGKPKKNQNKRRARSWPRDHNTAQLMRRSRAPGKTYSALPLRAPPPWPLAIGPLEWMRAGPPGGGKGGPHVEQEMWDLRMRRLERVHS